MSNLGFLFAGFASVWIIIFAYLWRLGRESARLQGRVESIEQRLRDR